jgi:hypothetical protein
MFIEGSKKSDFFGLHLGWNGEEYSSGGTEIKSPTALFRASNRRAKRAVMPPLVDVSGAFEARPHYEALA